MLRPRRLGFGQDGQGENLRLRSFQECSKRPLGNRQRSGSTCRAPGTDQDMPDCMVWAPYRFAAGFALRAFPSRLPAPC